jgi:two-component system OmpR family sensor kinase/two-component system sensor histidine kinase BaeS
MWHRRRRALFWRFSMSFGLLALLVIGGMGALGFLIARLSGGNGQTAVLVWVGGCGLAIALPILAIALAVRTFRGIASPLGDVMAAAEEIAQGDLSVRVSERGSGEFRQLTSAFNRMAAELARADQERRNLTADVAHELRTPLHILQGNLEGLMDGVYEATPAHVEAMLDETRALSRLVDDLLTLALAESGQLPLVIEPVQVADLLADVQTSFSGPAEAAGVSLETTTEADLTIQADAGRLDQVLSNLVANALRYTPPGGAITLRAASKERGVQLIVEDTGAGIPAEELAHIFDRFWRGDRSRSHTSGAGAGLGLAIARQLVQAHGGQIEVESEPKHGTTFIITLP